MKRAIAVALVAIGCSGSAELRGGSTVAAGTKPAGVAVGAWLTKDCRDAKGASAERATQVYLVQRSDGRRELVEQRPGYDSLVVQNSFIDGAEVVYQVSIKPEDGSIALHEFRLPSAGGPGRLSVSRRWKQVDSSEHRFRGYVEAAILTCSLSASPAEGRRPQ
jgi:hypothetical protein